MELLADSIDAEFESTIPRLCAMRFEHRAGDLPLTAGIAARWRVAVEESSGRSNRCGRVPDRRGVVRCGTVDRGRGARGLRLVRDRQPAARARRQGRRARRAPGQRARPLLLRRRPGRHGVRRRDRPGDRGPARFRRPGARALPRRFRRGPRPAVLRHPPAPPGRGRGRARGDPVRARAPRRRSSPAPTSSSTRARRTSTSCGRALSSSSPGPGRPARWRPRSSRSASRTACRSRPTSSSTCRFLPNPHWIDALRAHSGLDEDVRDYVMSSPEAVEFLQRIDELVAFLLPYYAREGKSYVSVAIGCTGGQAPFGRARRGARDEAAGRGFAPTVHHRDVNR